MLLYIIGAAIIALSIAVFYYLYKTKNKRKVNILLTFLRFISLFSLFLLLLNLKFHQDVVKTVKPGLVVAVDNSKSIKHLNSEVEVLNIVEIIKSNKELNDKFQIDFYSFGNNVKKFDSLKFNESQTNINQPFKQFKELYQNEIAPIILISDGNQSFGRDYEYFNYKQPVYPIVIGDTLKYADLKISQQNVNRYTYLKNKFPVEVFLNYDGDIPVNSIFSVFKGNQKVYSKKLNFSSDKNSQNVSFHLPANTVGTHYYTSRISYLENEKNTINNVKNFVVEVVDEQAEVLVYTSFLHPDVGMLKESIESNKQRKVTIKKSSNSFQLEDYQLVILYQPTSDFRNIFSELQLNNKNYFIVTGSKTDWNFLNTIQNDFSKKWIENTENYTPIFNEGFSTFITDDLGFNSFSPLLDKFGDVEFKSSFESLLYQQVGSFPTDKPMLATFEKDNRRGAVLFGENSWRWRMTSKLDSDSFNYFDNLINKIAQYLSYNIKSNRLTIDYKSMYYAESDVVVNATYLDNNYQFDKSAKLWFSVINSTTNERKQFPLFINGNNYTVSVNGLSKGNYDFTVSVEDQRLKTSGSFKILEFDVEQQFMNANFQKLKRISNKSFGKTFFVDNISQLIDSLLKDERFKSILKVEKKQNSLIDWEWLLGLIIVSLSIEWFIRKYNGLI